MEGFSPTGNCFPHPMEGFSPTGIEEVQSSRFKVQGSGWYDVFGRKLNSKPSQKGVYILDGKTVVIE